MKKNSKPAFKRKPFRVTRENLLMESFALLVAATAVYIFYFYQYLPIKQATEVAKKNAAIAAAAPAALPELWSSLYFTEQELADPNISARNADADGDGLSNYQEYIYGLNPRNKDTHNDGKGDAYYVANNLANAGASVPEDLSLTPLANIPKAFKEVGTALASDDLVDLEMMDQTFQLSKPYSRPVVPDSALRVVNDSQKASEDYTSNYNALITGTDAQRIYNEFNFLFSYTDEAQLAAIKTSLDVVLNGLYGSAVPRSLVEHLKRQIIFFNAIKSIVLSQEKMIVNPDDLSGWGDVMYQSRVISDITGISGDAGN